ncbi:MAG: DUF4258 domain-containing protein [Alphaproteobacteria bacterium]|nr:MAG: DUF4258 domain-containing protein [Alphaproteobacteria bacterium]
MPKPCILTVHARVRLQERRIDPKWMEDTVLDPDWTETDPRDPAVERRFRVFPRLGGRILRVACVETNLDIRVISVMFDRNARRRP